jgi:hypothetical protein
MEQERADLESAQWLRELRAALDDVLVDVRYAVEPESVDFVLVYSPGNRRRAIERFGEAVTGTSEIPPFDLISFESDTIPEPWNQYTSIRAVHGAAPGQGDGYPVRMARERVNLESAQWLAELRAALDDVLTDVLYAIEGEGVDFVLVYAPGQRNAAGERFTDALLRAADLPPFESISFEVGHVIEPFDQYRSVRALARAG